MSFVKKILFIFLIFSCFSCSTVPNFSGNRKLCCLLIDENNQPVSNCVGFLRKNNLLVRKAYSNEKGILVFDDVSNGKYELSFSRNGYKKTHINNLNFINPGKIYCFQLNTIEFSLNKVDELLIEEKWNECLEYLKNIPCDTSPSLEVLVSVYKFCVYCEKKDEKAAKKELIKISKLVKQLESLTIDISLLEEKVEVLWKSILFLFVY